MICSCEKNNITEGHEIVELIKTKEQGLQELARCRMALAKIVSLAFCNSEFRSYFRNKFGSQSLNGPYIEECLLLKFENDIVLSNGTTLIEFLNSIRDEEIDCIYQGHLIDKLWEIDKSATIKMPDIFIDYNWDINHAVPVVIASYPEKYANHSFIGYHSKNESKFYEAGRIPQILHVYIKGSEDYVIIDVNTLRDKYGNDLQEFLPQINYCKGLKDEMIKKSEKKGNDLIINLKLAYKSWFELCSFNGRYFNEPNCTLCCPRACENPENTQYILENLSIDELSFFQANSDLAFRESAGIFFQFIDKQQSIHYDDFVIPNLRYSELGRKFDVQGIINHISKIPYLRIVESNQLKSPHQNIQYLISNGIKTNINFNITLLQYGDIYFKKRFLNSEFTNPFNPENAILIGSGIYLNCDSNNVHSSSGGVNVLFRY